jgi:hypothetical protein
MPRAHNLALLLPLLAAAAAGCDADCRDAKRMDGTYAVWSTVTSTTEEIVGENLEEYPFEEVGLINGWSTWKLTYVPSNSTFQMEIDGQPFTGDVLISDENCNAFNLSFTGVYETEVGTTHTLLWNGNLVYMGDHLGGTWTYNETWTGGGVTGTLIVPQGEFNGNIEGSTADFSDTGG